MSTNPRLGPLGRLHRRAVQRLPQHDATRLILVFLASIAALGIGAKVLGSLGGVGAALTVIAGSEVVRRMGWRGIVMGMGLFLMPPSMLGESSFKFAVLGLLICTFVVVMTPPESTRAADSTWWRLGLTVVPVLVGTSFQLGTDKFPFVTASYMLTGLVACLIASRPRLVEETGRFVAMMITALAASYAVSMATGFHQITTLVQKQRTIFIASPFTPNSIGLPPRLLMMTGEPGLNVLFYIIAIPALAMGRGLWKWLGVAGLCAAIYFSQSTGTWLAGGIGIAVYLVYRLVQSGRYVELLAGLALIAAVAPSLVRKAIEAKAQKNPGSLTDRGLGQGGMSASSGMAGDVNLLRSWASNPVVTTLVITALVIILLMALRNALGLALATTYIMTGLLLQPLQWHFGAWFMVLAAMAVCDHRRDAHLPPRARIDLPPSPPVQGVPA